MTGGRQYRRLCTCMITIDCGDKVKRIVVVLSAAIILIGTLFLIFGENGIHLKRVRVRDIIGTSIERDYLEQAGVLSNVFVRTVAIENKKIDFLLERIGSASLARLSEEGEDSSAESLIERFVQEEPGCSKIRLIDRKGSVVYSTDDADVMGSVLYGSLFKRANSGQASLAYDPLVRDFIFYRHLSEPTKYVLLFYYTDKMLTEVFSAVDGIEFQELSISETGVVLVNFPPVSESEQQNLKNFVKMLLNENRGALRVQMQEYDKTVYFVHVPEPYEEWVVAIAVDTEKIGISSVGVLVLVIQAIVILTIVIFILTSIRMRRPQPVVELRREKTLAGEGPGEVRVGKEPEKELPGAVPQPASIPQPALIEEMEAEEVPELETGVIPLAGVEEVIELEKVGEAEIAEELEELEEVPEEVPAKTETTKELEKVPEDETGKGESEMKEDSAGGDSEAKQGAVTQARPAVSAMEDAGEESEPVEEDTDLQEEQPEKGMQRTNNKKDMEGGSELGTTDTFIEESITNDIHGIEGENPAFDSTLPNLDTLIGSTYTALKEGSPEDGSLQIQDKPGGVSEDIPPTIPDEAYEGQNGVSRDDELADLIQTIEEGEAVVDEDRAEESVSVFREFLSRIGLTRGALLVLDRHNNYRPVFIHGFNEKTGKMLVFRSDETIVSDILMKNKILFVREDAFMSRPLRAKFDLFDSSTIKRLFLVPVLRSGGTSPGDTSERGTSPSDRELPAAIMLVCLTTAEATVDEKVSNNILNELKKIKNKLSNIV